MQKQKGNVSVFVFYVALVLLALGGWIANIVKIWNSGFDVLTGMVIARCIGVFMAPLGAVLGFL